MKEDTKVQEIPKENLENSKEVVVPSTIWIEKKDKGYLVEGEGKRIFFPIAELVNIGCKNCVWRFHGQCPYGYPTEKGTMHKNEICNELIQFVSSLAEIDDSVSAVWEKFHIYKTRLQESVDYRDFLELKKKIDAMEKDSLSYSKEEHEKFERLKMDRNAAKLWWAKLNQQVIMSLQKVVDREVKHSEVTKLPGILSAKTINFNIGKKDGKS